MAIRRDMNKTSDTLLLKKKHTIMPPEIFEGEVQRRNKEILKLIGVSKNEPLILTITSIYKNKENCSNGDYKAREFSNQRGNLIAKYKENKDTFNCFVEGYLKALIDNKIKYEINEEVFID
ncbi:MAG TPA: hypothetical protein VIM70_08820 [Clostridium sp.]|uniref:hypothetical protein n=1 Tax=Clostridium sp. TaxID=1506 RepID=UPI002F934434